MLFAYFVYIAHLKNSHKEVLCPWKNLYSTKNQKQKKVLGKKKEEKKELHASVHISNEEVIVKPKFAIHNVKNEVFLYLCKYQP